MIKLILRTAENRTELVHHILQFAVHIEKRENGWCEMLVNLPILRVILCYSKLVYKYEILVKYSVFVINFIPSMIRISLNTILYTVNSTLGFIHVLAYLHE